ncbi:hypothetical protein Tsubulata_020576 [Turnera subulata]|uniref:Copper transport protein n=1 Tax=Turnera subulata TaxID=218843 RepID=A0A9Q0G757_9ROSI|nr:hypothetical protein Tsubulata_020576 [Turnera subulata]
MMHMTFYWGREVTLLLDTWRTKTWLAYALSLLACALASLFYQYLENRRAQLNKAAAAAAKAKPSSSAAIDVPLLRGKAGGGKWTAARVAGSVVFGINSAIGYLLMLAVMSFNGGVFVAVILGLSVGYFLFRSEDEAVADNPCACA